MPKDSPVSEDEVGSTTGTSLPVTDTETNSFTSQKNDPKKKIGHRLTPSTGEKKKKRKAIRPGQSAVNSEGSSIAPKLPVASGAPSLTVSSEGDLRGEEKETEEGIVSAGIETASLVLFLML